MLLALLLACGAAYAQDAPSATAAKPANLFSNGGLEDVRREVIGGQFQAALKAGCDLGKSLIINVPKNFDQFCGTKKLIMVTGEPGKEVHGGKYALTFNGSFYFNDRFPVKLGDVVLVTYYAKGSGNSRLIIHLGDGNGNLIGAMVPGSELSEDDEWAVVEHRLVVDNPKALEAWVRTEANGDITIDDIEITLEETPLDNPVSLITNGGFEILRNCTTKTGYYQQAAEDTDFGKQGLIRMPVNFQMTCGAPRVTVVEGEPGKEVYGGKRALQFQGSFYLSGRCPIKDGDVVLAKYYAKGTGAVRIILHTFDQNGAAIDQLVVNPVPLKEGEWVQVSHRYEIKAANAVAAQLRFDSANTLVTIDNLTVTLEDKAQ
jgi:hypothetical protein